MFTKVISLFTNFSTKKRKRGVSSIERILGVHWDCGNREEEGGWEGNKHQ
jgi:hypothetical protein